MSTKKIRKDHAKFRKVINGKLNERLKKFIKTGHILKMRPNGNGKLSIPIPQIDQPQFRFGKMNQGSGKGDGEPGETIDKDFEPGFGPGAGELGEGRGIIVDVDVEVEDVINALEEELHLPRMKPKNQNTYNTLKTQYTDISKTGPRSLINKRRTIKQAMKRGIAEGTWGEKKFLPGNTVPVPVLDIRNQDFLYRQWNQVTIPSANALIVFARDGSGSMDDLKCSIVSDLSFWIETWIKRDFNRTETLYLWHDTVAKEVSQYDFYHERHGGGTLCSSILQLLKTLIKLKYPPGKWNIYLFYFGDGDNFHKDNVKFVELLIELEDQLNMAGIVQVLATTWSDSLKEHIDNDMDVFKNPDFIRTASVGGQKGYDSNDFYYSERNETIDEEMKKAIVDILGIKSKKDVFEGII